MTTDGPRKAVFATAELLENILLFTPPKTVFAAQRVCRQFRDLVKTSATIRQKLFLRLSGTSAESWIIRTEPSYPVTTHFIARDTKSFDSTDHNVKPCTPARLNPLLIRSGPRVWCSPTALRVLWGSGGESCNVPFPKAMAGPASWKETYVTDPPCCKARIKLAFLIKSKPPIHGTATREVSLATGLTLGDMINGALHQEGVMNMWSKGQRYETVSEVRLFDKLQELEQKSGKTAVISIEDSHFHLQDVALPTEEEWKLMSETGSTLAKEQAHSGEEVD